MTNPDFSPVLPWPAPALADCDFYTCMDFPDGETIEGVHWDIRNRFDRYVGGYPLAGKSVLDVGTASGFLAFSAEAAGAKSVTAVDASDSQEFNRIPFADTTYTQDRAAWMSGTDVYLTKLKASFWYGWHKKKSAVEVVYVPASTLWRWNRRFDVVIAGAIVEHFSDPIPFITSLASLADEAVILAFTPVGLDESLTMRAMNPWDQPSFDYSWFELSLGLYRRIFANLGFSIELTTAQALCHEYDSPLLVDRPTLIARRLKAGDSIDTAKTAPLAPADARVAGLTRQIDDLQRSTSWRLTAPLRRLSGLLRKT